MKPMSFVVLVHLLSLFYLPPEQYLVTYHTGIIKTKNGKVITDGMRISSTESLIYDSPTDLLWLVIPGKGDVQLHISANAKKEGNLWVELIETSLHLKVKQGVFFGKPGPQVLADEITAADTVNDHLLLQTFNAYHFDAGAYQNGYFFLQVTLPGGSIRSKPLSTKQDSLILEANIFAPYLKVNNATIFEIGFASHTNVSSVAKIYPALDTTGRMDAMIHSFIKAVGPTTKRDEVYERCYWLIYNTLGKPCMSNYKTLFEKANLNIAK